MSEIELLSERAREILLALCRDYVATGQPISSKALRERHGLAWSTATIRNELKALESLELLRQPHAVSGRVPTSAGLAVYVDSLPGDERPSPELQRVMDAGIEPLRGIGLREPSGALRGLTRVMAELSGCVAVAFFGDAQRPRLSQVEVWPTGPGRALVVLATVDGARSVRRVEFDPDLFADPSDLIRVRELLGELLIGRDVEQARVHFEQAVASEQAKLDHVFAQAVRWGLRLCGGLAMDPLWLKVAGQRSLTSHAGTEGLELGGILGVLEDYQRLAHVLCQLLPQGREQATVRLGLDLTSADDEQAGLGAALVRTSSLSLVGCRVSGASGWLNSSAQTGVLALLGPPRMDYRTVIPLVEYAARALQKPA